MIHLLDANVLVALTTLEHERHDTAAQWFTDIEGFALCPVVEGALLRFGLRLGETSATGKAIIVELRAHPKFRFWCDDISYGEVDLSDVQGHRQVTDVYLAALAATHSGVLATFDRGIAALRPSQTVLIESL